MSLVTDVQQFLLFKESEGLAPGTLTTYKWALALLLEALGNVDTLAKDDGQRFMVFVRAHRTARQAPLTNKSIENIWIACRSFDAWRQKELGQPQWYFVERPDVSYDQPHPFSADDIKRLLHAATFTATSDTHNRKQFTMHRHTAKRDTAMLLLMLDTGMRAGEVGRLDVGDVDLRTGEITVDRWGSGKKSKGRMVFVGERTRKLLLKLCLGRKPDAPLFETQTDKRLNASGILHLVHAMGVRAGVKKCHPHRFRHTFAIQYLRNGGDVFTLQRFLGHSSLAMVKRYVELSHADDASAHHRASPVDAWGL